jgi:CheY-like chemotaxis protein
MAKEIKVLVVDDNNDVRYTIVETLKQLDSNYKVSEAKNGKEALEKAKSKPDVILLDIMMPDMDGQEVAMQLRGSDDTRNIPIIFLSAKTDSISQDMGKMVAQDYITKPFEPNDLDKRIKKIVK